MPAYNYMHTYVKKIEDHNNYSKVVLHDSGIITLCLTAGVSY